VLGRFGNPQTICLKFVSKSKLQKWKSTQEPININANDVQWHSERDQGTRSIPGAQRGTTVKMKFEAFWRHLANFGRHCNVGATADTFGRWQWEGNILRHGTGLIWRGVLHVVWRVALLANIRI
jgi:hypothetical protein